MVNFRARLNEIFTDFTSLDVKKKRESLMVFVAMEMSVVFNRVDIIINVSFNFRILSVRMLSRIGIHVNCESRSNFFFNFFYMCWHEAVFLLFYILPWSTNLHKLSNFSSIFSVGLLKAMYGAQETMPTILWI